VNVMNSRLSLTENMLHPPGEKQRDDGKCDVDELATRPTLCGLRDDNYCCLESR